jgi:hypothetical protein
MTLDLLDLDPAEPDFGGTSPVAASEASVDGGMFLAADSFVDTEAPRARSRSRSPRGDL